MCSSPAASRRTCRRSSNRFGRVPIAERLRSHSRAMPPLTLVRQLPLRVLLLLAPAIFLAHFLEEGPGFVTWFNAHVARGITEPLFWSVNYTALAITFGVVVLEWLSGTAFSATVAVTWISFL